MKTGTEQWEGMMQWLQGQASSNQHARLALDHMLRLEMTRECLSETQAERAEYLQQLRDAKETLHALGAVLDVAGRACRMEATAHEVYEAAVDKAPFRNLMSTMYGLGPVGEPLKKRKGRTEV